MNSLISLVFNEFQLSIFDFQVGDGMVKYLEDQAANNTEFEAKELFTNYAVAAIATTGFGIESKSFSDPQDPFKDQASTAFALFCEN